MPIALSSRYYGLSVYVATDASGVAHPTIPIRPNSPPPAGSPQYRHIVAGVEDIEYLAWRYYGLSAAWWRIAEANPPAFPLDLETGSSLSIPSPSDVSGTIRTRSF
jgi:hypothetical protein